MEFSLFATVIFKIITEQILGVNTLNNQRIHSQYLLGQGPVLHCGAFGCSEKRNFEKQINHLLCGQCRQCYLQAEVK